MAYTFKSHLTSTEPIIYAYDERGNWVEEFVGNPNKTMTEFRGAILDEVSGWLKSRGANWCAVSDGVMEAHFLLSAIVSDAAKSGTWMTADDLWNQEVWRVVNMANVVRAA